MGKRGYSYDTSSRGAASGDWHWDLRGPTKGLCEAQRLVLDFGYQQLDGLEAADEE